MNLTSRRWFSLALLFCAAIAATFGLARKWGLDDLDQQARDRVHLVAAELFRPIEKYQFFPQTVALAAPVQAALLLPTDPRRVVQANEMLRLQALAAGVQVLYLINDAGRGIASSNWNQPDSFVGHDFSFRPYFQDAIKGREGRFYALGTVSRVPGYYLSYPVHLQGRIAGVVVAKIDLTTIDRYWRDNHRFELVVTDEQDVVFLSSRPEWKYRPLRELKPEQMQVLSRTRQYEASLRAALEVQDERPWSSSARVWRIPQKELRGSSTSGSYAVAQQKIQGSPWTVTVLLPSDRVLDRAWFSALALAGALALVILAALYYGEQRKRSAERVAAQRQMQESHERFLIVSKATSDVVWDWDLKRDLLWWNENMEALFGHRRDELEPGGASWVERIVDEDRNRVVEGIHQVIDGVGDRWSDEYRFRCRDGSIVFVLDRGFIIRGEDGAAVRMVGSMIDITHRKEAERAIHQLAFYDPLTSLPNRSLLQERLSQALTNAGRTGEIGALLFIDLDNFKSLNDTLGHNSGDLLLEQAATRLRACVRRADTVSRLGGDEFVVLLEQLAQEEKLAAHTAQTVAEKILDAFASPFDLRGYHAHTTPSIGVALFNGTQLEPDEILKHADIAMYEAKASGRNGVRFFDPGMREFVLARSALEMDLRRVFDQGELDLHYQPQCDREGQIIGVEALLRWHHPVRGPISPTEFIPVAEQAGLIGRLGRWVLEQACLHLTAWSTDREKSMLSISVNVSARQFRQPGFVADIEAILEKTGAPGRYLTLELTESCLVTDIEDAIAKMAQLRRLGISFSLDDFGTGYSSLAYLHRLPIQQVKIDRSFVSHLQNGSSEAAIIRTIITLARALDLQLIAEGVETEAQRAFLQAEGCDLYQGFLYGRPMPVGELRTLLAGRAGAKPVAQGLTVSG